MPPKMNNIIVFVEFHLFETISACLFEPISCEQMFLVFMGVVGGYLASKFSDGSYRENIYSTNEVDT